MQRRRPLRAIAQRDLLQGRLAVEKPLVLAVNPGRHLGRRSENRPHEPNQPPKARPERQTRALQAPPENEPNARASPRLRRGASRERTQPPERAGSPPRPRPANRKPTPPRNKPKAQKRKLNPH